MSTATEPSTLHAPRPREGWRALLMGPEGGEEITPHTVDELPDPHWMGPVRSNMILLLSAASGFVGSLAIVVTAPLWYLAPPGSWRLTIAGIPHGDQDTSSWFAGVTFVVSVILMAAGWIGLIGRADRQRWRERSRMLMVGAVIALWAAPMLLAPPLLSNDAYSYAAQGELASRGFDPTSQGPSYLLGGDFMIGTDSIWRNSPAPYGPVWIGLSRAVVEVTGHDAANAIWGFRVLAVVGVSMTAVGVALIARSYKLSPAAALALAVANPLVLLHLIGGAHNDALMLGFLALGLAAFRRDKRVLTVVLVALAVAVKLPAAVALVYIGWAWAGRGAPMKRRLGSIARVFGAAIAIVVALCIVIGIGPGWLFALQGTNSVTSTFSVTTKLGYVITEALHLSGVGLGEDLVVGAGRLVGLALAAFIALLLLFRTERLGVVRCVGFALAAVILLGPVVWPWYLPAGFAILAAAGVGRWRPSYVVVSFAACLLVFPRSVNAVPSLLGWQHVLGLGVLMLIAGAAYGATLLAEWWHERRLEKLGPRQAPDDPSAAEPGDLSDLVTA